MRTEARCLPLHQLAQYVAALEGERRQIAAQKQALPGPGATDEEDLFAEGLTQGWHRDRFYEVVERRLVSDPLAAHRPRAPSLLSAARHYALIHDNLRRRFRQLGVRVSGVLDGVYKPFVIRGVEVIVADPLVLRCQRRDGRDVGLLSFCASKGRPHGEDSVRTAAVLLSEFALFKRAYLRARVQRRMCLVVDVFAGLIVDAECGWQRRLERVERACDEIARDWSGRRGG